MHFTFFGFWLKFSIEKDCRWKKYLYERMRQNTACEQKHKMKSFLLEPIRRKIYSTEAFLLKEGPKGITSVKIWITNGFRCHWLTLFFSGFSFWISGARQTFSVVPYPLYFGNGWDGWWSVGWHETSRSFSDSADFQIIWLQCNLPVNPTFSGPRPWHLHSALFLNNFIGSL